MNAKQAVVLLSGGLDSATTLAIARDQGFRTSALSFQYGQRHSCELESAKRVADQLGAVQHKVLTIDLRTFGHSALTDAVKVPKGRGMAEMSSGIPITYVPARNTIFLSYALAWAEVLEIGDIFLGVNALDYSGYPDCRPEYIAAFETMANLATKAAVEGRQRHDDPHAAHQAHEGPDHPGRYPPRCRLRADLQLLRPLQPGGSLRSLRFLSAATEGIC